MEVVLRIDYHDSQEDDHHHEKGFEADEAIMKRSVTRF